MQKKLLILGGNRYNVAGIQAASRAGFTTIVADRNVAAPGLKVADVGLPIDLSDYDRLLPAIVAQDGIDGVVCMSEAGVRAAAEISRRFTLPSISIDAAARATSKAAMRRAWLDLKTYSVDFCVVRTESQAFAACQRLAMFPLIFKPDRSFGGSRGVTRVQSADEIHSAFAFAKSGTLDDGDVVIEPCVQGTEHSAEVLIWNGETSVLCIGQKVKSQYPYRVDVSVQYPAPLGLDQQFMVEEMCQQAVAALGLTQGAAHIEFAYTADGPVLFELGARCGGGHTPQIAHHVSGVDEFTETCRMACGMSPAQFRASEKRGADYRFLIFPLGKLATLDVPNQLRSHPSILDIDVMLQPGDEVRPLQTTTERAGFVVAVAADRLSAVNLADWACRQVTVTYDDSSVGHAFTLAKFQESTNVN